MVKLWRDINKMEDKEKIWYKVWIFVIIGSFVLGILIYPLTGNRYVFSLIGELSLIYAGYNLGRVFCRMENQENLNTEKGDEEK